MTKSEFLTEYGDVLLKFSSYYKYTFSYRGKSLFGTEVVVSFGGSADDVYRSNVVADEEVSLRELNERENLTCASMNGEVVFLRI